MAFQLVKFVLSAFYTVGTTTLTLAGLTGARWAGFLRGGPHDDLADPGEMERLLRSAGLDVKVASVSIEPMESDGALSEMFSAKLEVVGGKDASQVPSQLVLKTREPALSAKGMLLDSVGLGTREADYYDQVAGATTAAGFKTARCFGVKRDLRGEVIVLERVPDAKVYNLVEGIPENRVPTVLSQFARLHGTFWMGRGLADDGHWPTGLPRHFSPGAEFLILVQMMALALRSELAGNVPEGEQPFPEPLMDLLRIFLDRAWAEKVLRRQHEQHLMALCMGDTNSANFLWQTAADGTDIVTVIDFQAMSLVHPLSDVFKFLLNIPAAAFDRTCESLLAYYHGELRNVGATKDLPALDSEEWLTECRFGLIWLCLPCGLAATLIRSKEEMPSNVRQGLPTMMKRFSSMIERFKLLDFAKSMRN